MIAVIRRFMGKPACIEALADLILSLLARAGKFKTDALRERSVVEGRSEGPLGGCRIPVCSLSANSEVQNRDLRWPLTVDSRTDRRANRWRRPPGHGRGAAREPDAQCRRPVPKRARQFGPSTRGPARSRAGQS